MMFVDEEGVPQIVQKVRYSYTMAAWYVTFFDGEEVFIAAEHATPSLGLMARPRAEEYHDAAVYAARLYPEWRRIQRPPEPQQPQQPARLYRVK